MSEITKKKQSRRHHAYTTKTLARVKSLLGSDAPGVGVELARLKLTLTEKIKTKKTGRSDNRFVREAKRRRKQD